jgi:hypothetical protein
MFGHGEVLGMEEMAVQRSRRMGMQVVAWMNSDY